MHVRTRYRAGNGRKGVRVSGGPHEVRMVCSLEKRPGDTAILTVYSFDATVEPVDIGRGDSMFDLVPGVPVRFAASASLLLPVMCAHGHP